ncbi:electron transport complex protein RnfG [Clostridiales Family XIII bacterium PM5-7]
MKNNTFKEYVAPIVVLVVICLVITAALAATYDVAKPIIDENSTKAANEARAELLPAADSFTVYDGELVEYASDKVFVEECYIADNGSGMVITVSTKSFGGALTEMIGIDADGNITGVKVTAHADTPGLGTKAHDTAYLEQYKKLSELTATSAKADSSVTYVTGATISSNAVHYGVYAALEQYKAVGGAK